MNPQPPEPIHPATGRTTLVYDNGAGEHLEVNTEALAAFAAHLDESLAKLAARWAAWAPPIAQKANRRSQFGR